MKYYIEPTKTDAVTRDLPMIKEVYKCFKVIMDRRMNEVVGPEADGYKGFLYLDKFGQPAVALHWEKYNRICKEELPRITPHT